MSQRSKTGKPHCWVVTGGGTGGHIYPALAAIQQIRDDELPVDIQYVGKTHGMEADKVPAQNISFYGIQFSGMPRSMTWRWVPWLFQLSMATLQVLWQFLTRWKPSVVFSTGGYVTAPVLLAALLTRTPYVVHEPDAHAGLVNRLFSRWASHVTTAFEKAFPGLPTERVTVAGNPIRSSIAPSVDRDSQKKAFSSFFSEVTLNHCDDEDEPTVLLVTGGSQGAASINQAVVNSLETLLKRPSVYVVHQTGARGYDDTKKWLKEISLSEEQTARYWCQPFIEDMPSALSIASLALCRSGSLTLSEHCAAGVPMILVPYPYAAADHQTKNAQRLVDAGAARLICDEELTCERFLEEWGDLLEHPEILKNMAKASMDKGRQGAASVIVEKLRRLSI